jgi:hypothetical protein
MRYFREQRSAMAFVRTLYYVYEAKAFSQSTPGVGKATDVAFLSSRGIRGFYVRSPPRTD